MCPKDEDRMANHVDPNQTAPIGAYWSGLILVCTVCSCQSVPKFRIFEPSHEIMVLFIFRKLILQTHMRSHLVGLDV